MTISLYLVAKVSIYFEIHKFSEDYFLSQLFFIISECVNTPPLLRSKGGVLCNKGRVIVGGNTRYSLCSRGVADDAGAWVALFVAAGRAAHLGRRGRGTCGKSSPSRPPQKGRSLGRLAASCPSL